MGKGHLPPLTPEQRAWLEINIKPITPETEAMVQRAFAELEDLRGGSDGEQGREAGGGP
jgi:hypothetical protein